MLVAGCAASPPGEVVLTVAASAVGAEGEVMRAQLARFEAAHPGLRVVERVTPDAADARHQLFVQWLASGSGEPDVMQIDIVWTAELAAAGFLAPLDELAGEDFAAEALRADRFGDHLYALPWFVDVPLLYWRRDLLARAPRTLDELWSQAARKHGLDYGFVWQGARYEGLVTVFLERLRAFEGGILDENGHPQVASTAGRRALESLEHDLRSGATPREVLTWQEEQVRAAFQSGRALFMRNWPYAAPLLAQTKVPFGVAPLPSRVAGIPVATLGGGQLAVNARSQHPELARALVEFLAAPAQMIERAKLAGQIPARPSLYEEVADFLPLAPSELRAVVDASTARPATPVYAELTEALQIRLHRVLTGQAEAQPALDDAARAMERILDELTRPPEPRSRWWWLLVLLVPAIFLLRCSKIELGDLGAWRYLAPALVVMAAVLLFPVAATIWESLHQHDLRTPWRGRPFVGFENYREALATGRFWSALAHTALFTVATVTLEIGLGLALALSLHRVVRARGVVRAAALLPWALPTVVAALVWRFIFEARAATLFTNAWLAWIPIVVADVWKTTPFVALLLLAGLQSIDESLYEAARLDGARPWQMLLHITLPLLRPAMLVAVLFRVIDAIRVFDLVYVLTGGGPGSATEPIALYAFGSILHHLRFGYGAALSVLLFCATLLFAIAYLRRVPR